MTTSCPENEVLLEIDDGVAIITLNRPDRLNALIQSMMQELSRVIGSVANDPDVGCIVLTGAGRGFCAGGDLKSGDFDPPDRPVSREEGGRVEQTVDRLTRFANAARLLHDMPKPTIAMINGPCAGAGIGLAGACDLRFASEEASFTSAFSAIGAAGDFGSTYFWTKIVGTGVAREIFMLSEKLDAQQALEKGLYTRVFPARELRSQTLATARKLARGPRMAWRYMKQNLNAAEDQSFQRVLEQETVNMVLSTQAAAAIWKSELPDRRTPPLPPIVQTETGG